MDTTSPGEALRSAFVVAWWEAHGEEGGGRALHDLAMETGLWMPNTRDAVSDLSRLSIALSRRRDRVYGEVQLPRGDARRRKNLYALAPVSALDFT